MEMKEHDKPRVYPVLDQQHEPSAPNVYVDIDNPSRAPLGGHAYRLKKINEIQKDLQVERDRRASLAKKYQRSVNILSGLCYTFELASAGTGIAGVTLLTTVLATPVVIAMEGVAFGVGGLGFVGNLLCDKVLSVKAIKHLKIKTAAESSLYTISDHISKALKDEVVSDEEYSLIITELDKFNKLKDEIRSNAKTKLDDETKQSLIKQGKVQAIEQFQSMFGKSIS